VREEVFGFRDTCNVYVFRNGREAVAVDFGSGAVLGHLGEIGADRLTDVLITHHHRDQVEGLASAVAAGARVWVPPAERELIEGAGEFWQARALDCDYDLRQDRFSLLEPVPVSGTVREYRTDRYGGFGILAIPTPGHTAGSVSYAVEAGGERLVCCGDLLYGPGKVWSLAAMQWTYSGSEGIAASILSLLSLADAAPDLVLPSHGVPIENPRPAIDLVRARLSGLIDRRVDAPSSRDLAECYRHPWEEVTPHLLRNRTSVATTYALLSAGGEALLFDFGYDMSTGLLPYADRASRRPLLSSLSALRRDHGVRSVEAVIPTHYHDDHVAGMNLLRDVYGTQVWCPANFAAVLTDPRRFDLPCLWWDAIPVDRSLPPGEEVRWHEYRLGVHPLPGHTLYAAAFDVTVDGRRVIVTGDQQDGGWVAGERRELLNYQYRNRFGIDDFRRSAELYARLRPDIMVSGHWAPRTVTKEYLDMLLAEGQWLADCHRDLLPAGELDLGADGVAARIEPYRSSVRAGDALPLSVSVRNPFTGASPATVRLILPRGWDAKPAEHQVTIGGRAETVVHFQVSPGAGAGPVRRARVAASLTIGDLWLGQHAEALVDVT
jgi:glyoxylase-like metal-dependent hydrolase (beta-lactamase superfamily II)